MSEQPTVEQLQAQLRDAYARLNHYVNNYNGLLAQYQEAMNTIQVLNQSLVRYRAANARAVEVVPAEYQVE